MTRLRRLLVYPAILAIVAYCLAVLVHTERSPDLGFDSPFWSTSHGTRQGQTGIPAVVTSRLAESDLVGVRLETGDTLLRFGGTTLRSVFDLKESTARLRRAPAPQRRYKSVEQLAEWTRSNGSPTSPTIAVVDVGPDRWARLEFVKHRSATSAEAALPVTAWVRLKSISGTTILQSLAWFSLQMLVFGAGVFVAWKRPGDLAATLFALLCADAAVTVMGLFHWAAILGSRLLVYPLVPFSVLLAPLALNFCLLFPRPVMAIRRRPGATLVAVYFVPAALMAWLLFCLAKIDRLRELPSSTEELARWLGILGLSIGTCFALAGGLFLVGQIVLVHGYRCCRAQAQRQQARWLLGAALLGSLPLAGLGFLALCDPVELAFGRGTRGALFALSLLFAAAYTVSITRAKLLVVGRIVNRGLLYVAISLAATAVYCLLVGAGTALVGKYYFQWENALAAGLTAMLIVILLGWFRDRFQKAVDRRFLRQKYQLETAMRRLSAAVEQLVEPGQLARQMLQSARDCMGATRGAVYLRDKSHEAFALAARIGWPTITEQLRADGPLVNELCAGSIVASRLGLAAQPTAGQLQLRDLEAELGVALELEQHVVGLLILGPKADETPYTAEDRNFLAALARTMTLALQSAEGHRTIERLQARLSGQVAKIAEQQQRISFLQGELLSRTALPRGATRPDRPVPPAPVGAALAHEIRGSSAAVQAMLAQVAKVANSSASVLIRGESGTGKELLARAIHTNSLRKAGPFVAVHCASLSPGLFESELFGHVKGAFTGADRDRIGRFEMAHGGTLFLDEIGDIQLETQIKLLRVLQEKAFERVGGTQRIQVDVRVIAATHQHLEELIEVGRFREDLFYRLNVISLSCPPLRERAEDIFELALWFLRVYAQSMGKRLMRIEEDALEVLARYAWPGNIRQLENVMERAVVLADGPSIGRADLPPEVLAGVALAGPAGHRRRRVADRRQPEPAATAVALREPPTDGLVQQRARLAQVLAECGGNKALAARRLGLPRSTLFSQMTRLGLD